ncbi:MAG: DUF5372 family protein [Thermocrispum sp.]
MRQAMVIRSRHPMEGQTLQVLGQMRRHGRLELLLVLADGSKSLIPAAWTDQAEPTETMAAPATVATLADLEHAVVLVAALLARDSDPRVQAACHPPSQEDDDAACTAEFAPRSGSGATDRSSRPASRVAGRRGDHRARGADRQDSDVDERGGRR